MKTIFYNFRQHRGLHTSTRLLSLFATVLLLFSACKEDEITVPVLSRVPALTASAQSLELQQNRANQAAITFNWTAGTNYGTNAAIEYFLQIDKSGSEFATPIEMGLGKGKYSASLKVSELNALAKDELQIASGTSGAIQARLKAIVSAPGIEPEYSNVVEVRVTPYELVTATLYMIGDATPNGWSADEPTEMTADPSDPTTFTARVQLVPGSFKFITSLGQFLPSYNKGADEQTLVYRTEDSQPDDQFVITEGGAYKVTVNLVALTIAIEKQAGPPYSQLWAVGSATPNGWDLDNAAAMQQNQADPFIFTYNEVLSAGELKFATAKDWGAPFYRPTEADAPITSTAVQLSAGDPDYKWVITEPGAYKISLNLRTNTISIDPFTPYTQLWLVGDATPAGWNIDNPTPMTKDPNDPNVFTYTGQLNAGEFKIPTDTGDWATDYFMPVVNNQALTETTVAFVPGGDPDHKWAVAEAGNYTIVLNQLYHTISIQKN